MSVAAKQRLKQVAEAMKYLVDPQLIVDVLERGSRWSKPVAALFERHRGDELILAQVSYLELNSSFVGIQSMQDRFLEGLGVRVARIAPPKVLDAAYAAWSRYQAENPSEKGGTGAFGRLYIGAYALLYDGIMTRDGALYRKYYESLNVVEP